MSRSVFCDRCKKIIPEIVEIKTPEHPDGVQTTNHVFVVSQRLDIGSPPVFDLCQDCFDRITKDIEP